METLTLKAQLREVKGKKVNSLRNQGLVPAVMYGKDVNPVSLAVDKKEFDRIFKEAGESSLVDLTFEDGSKKVLVSDFQVDPVTGEYLHIDFHQVKLNEKVKAEVPIEFENEEIAPAVKELEGTLVKEKNEIEVECLPTEIPHAFVVDVSPLKTFEDRILISDLKVPQGVEVLNDQEEIIALVKPPRSEEELESLDQEVVEDVEKVEVETKEGTEEGEGSSE